MQTEKIHFIKEKETLACSLKVHNTLYIGQNAAQHCVHLTLGILRQSQAVSYALAFFWLDGFAVPAPAQVPITALVKS